LSASTWHIARPNSRDSPAATSLGIEFTDPVCRQIVPNKLTENVLLAHPAGDELGGLRAEVEHQHAILVRHADLAPVSRTGGRRIRHETLLSYQQRSRDRRRLLRSPT
jgi:hypothetical protein